MDEMKEIWLEDKERNGWVLPQKANPLLRLPIIRYVRFVVLNFKVMRRAQQWGSAGIGFGAPNPYDEWVLYAIFRGWC